MAPRGLCTLLCVAFLIGTLSGTSAQDVNHGKPREPPVGSLSKFNPNTMHYEPVNSDSRYTYYRIKINLNETFSDTFRPDPNEPHLMSAVISGDAFDNSTGIKVGTFDTSSISTVARDNKDMQYLATLAVELGPNGDDTIFIKAAFDRANFIAEPIDFDLAVVGGTGRYKGATGEAIHSGTRMTVPDNVYVAEVAVPRFKRF
ncbi:hypothetical protein OEZ85_004034 [Tetradesmus obliquus]|uniref:Dirigent protein n=1 Tax=Tetradesmus obliquus TaxID=3088 RepID=A0ABY8UEE2_TETOB|nr:hypothetical protein OEZ85_004034 [Tetradesmus obliquus]